MTRLRAKLDPAVTRDLLWPLRGRPVVVLTVTTAAIQTPSGAILTCRRHRTASIRGRYGATAMTGAHRVPRGPGDNWRDVAEAASAPAEPVTIAEWWKNRRGESIRLVHSQFQGRSIFDLQPWYSADGKLKTGKGFVVEVWHLQRLKAVIAKAEATARVGPYRPSRGPAMSEAPKPLAAKRERLPDRRASETFSFELDGVRYYATVGLYSDGRLSEISYQAGSAIAVAARDAAMAISFALQFGARREDIGRALLRDSSGRASGTAIRALDLGSGREP
jgi:hypothetical protein